MKGKWIMVNGAKIERSFFEENVSEARSYSWIKTHWKAAEGHGHCMVCGLTISGKDICYRSKGGWLCGYCYDKFVDPGPR